MLANNKVPGTESSRVGRLLERINVAPREVCIERARLITRAMEENWDKHPLMRMSLALEHILDNMSVIIRDDELIVGCRTSKLKGAPLYPENKARWIGIDVDSFNDRMLQTVGISREDQAELRDEILPSWEGRTAEELFEQIVPPDVLQDMDKYIFTMILEITYGLGHYTIDHERTLSLGLSGLRDAAREKLGALTYAEFESDKSIFYEAVIRSLEAAIRFANRYADLADALAQKEKNPARASELRNIAGICRRVPEHPPRTFHEAVQFVYFTHLIAQIECGGNSISLGRIDQFLYPYFQADIANGSITPEQAGELVSLLFIKTNEIWNILEEAFIPGGEGPEGKTTQNVTVGGCDRDGADATNELSYVVMDAYAAIQTVQPNFSVRIGPGTPEDFFTKAVQYAKDGVLLHLFNDEVVIRSLVNNGHTIEDARDYGLVGCVEPNAQGKTFGSTFAVQISGIKCLEFALSNGVDNIFGTDSGQQTGDAAAFSSFDDVWNAYAAQLSHFLDQMQRGMEALDRAVAELVPSPFESAVVRGPLDKGIDLTRGGAIYNSTGVQYIGFANVVDSLYSIKKAVFDDRTMSMEELAAMLASDWDDAEDKRLYLLNKIPKYGNDDDDVDAMAARVLEHFCGNVVSRSNFRGGHFWPGVFSVGFHITMGSFAGASPDGRFSGDVLGNGATPTNGNALKGPTAVINSITKLPLDRSANGVNLNMRFNGTKLRTETLLALMKTYFRKGGYQVQFNMVGTDTLRAAQADPEKYRDLVVRVSGYSALFTGLSEMAQDEIISRTEYEI